MNAILALSLNDFRSTFRDPIFKGLLVFPFVVLCNCALAGTCSGATLPAIAPYKEVILMWACMQSATMFGMIYAFLFLEEKEENVWQAIRVLPISGLTLVASRLLIGLVVSTLVNFTLIHWGGIVTLPLYQELLLSLQYSFCAPLLALMLGAFANNRIEGLAQMKIASLLLNLPGLIYFLPQKFLHVLALIPTYWSFRSLEMAADQNDKFWLFFAIGTIFYLGSIYWLNRRLEFKTQS